MSANPDRGQPLQWRTPTIALILGGAIAVLLGGASRAFTTHYRSLPGFGFSNNLTFKSWLASLVLVLVLAQLLTALWMFGRIPFAHHRPTWLARTHRSVGSLAFLISLPVAFCCLYSYGFAPTPFSARTLAHSILGCLFYGVFATKVLFVRSHGHRRWALPLAGGTLVTVVVLLWMTSALWFFHATSFHT